jgi:hypothetical protein
MRLFRKTSKPVAAVKGPIVADDLYQVTGRGHIFTAAPSGVPETIDVGDLVRFTSTSPRVLENPFFSVDSTYKVIGIEVVRTLMYPPKVRGYGFVVSRVEEDMQ